MENLRRIGILSTFVVLAVIKNDVSSQTYSSGGGVYNPLLQQQQEAQQNLACGVQDVSELPDLHAAAPWAAALFYVDGDLFSPTRQQKYMNAAIFISRNLAITTGSSLLAQQQTELQTKLQLLYGNRASGKHTLIRVRKVEPLVPPRQPLALRVDGMSSPARSEQSSSQTKSKSHVDLYLLHLESSIDISPFSRPICINGDIFQHKSQYYGSNRSSKKVFLSGYATKNETHGPHVVYFTGDLEWRVNSWDTDNINLIMRDQQVSYGFLPKHFNPGSGLIVKVNNQFFLAGIVLRSSETQTTLRSLEKYVQTLESKGLDPPTPPQQTPSPQTAYIPLTAAPSYGRPSYEASQVGNQGTQYPSSPQQGQQQQQQHTNVYNPSNSNQFPGVGGGSTAGAQITYLKEVEASEFEENRRTTSRTTLRSENPYYASSPRPNPVQRPTYQQQQQQQQPIYHENQNGDGHSNTNQQSAPQRQQHHQATNPYLGQPSYTSTPKTVLSQIGHPIDQRPLQGQQTNSQQFSYPQQPVRCSHDFLEGVDIECLTRQRGVSAYECVKSAPPNTKIRLGCKPHYVPYDGDKLLEKTCDSSGNWLPRKAFACKLDCGNVDHTVGYIVHGTTTESEQWPWHAALFKKVNGTTYSYICGATLITRSILITAAHCVHSNYEQTDYSNFKIVVGAISSNFYSNSKDPTAQDFDIKEIKINEHYNPRNFEADIAVLQLDEPVRLTEYVRPVCFPFPSDDNKKVSSYQLSEGNQGIVVGFGTTEDWSISKKLRMTSLPVVSVRNCTTVLERLPSSTQYCAGYTNGTGICEGDSGGSQVFRDQISKRFYIQGVISHGNKKDSANAHSRCDNNKYTVFTKVGSFAEWVKQAVYDLEYDYNRRRRR